MKHYYYLTLLIAISCTQQTKEATSGKIDQDTITVLKELVKPSEPKLQYSAELSNHGENPDSPYPARIDSAFLSVSLGTETILSKKITKYDFKSIFTEGFIDDGEIFRTEILKLDTIKNKVLLLMMFGLPNSDSHVYEVVDVIDFNNSNFLIPAPYSCYPHLRLKDNLIATCEGVYTYEEQVFKLKECCAVFSCLINDQTFFYVHDDLYNKLNVPQLNAHYIDLKSSDTIKSFHYDQFTNTISYSTLIWYSEEFEKLTYLNLDDSTLTVVNQELDESTYQLSDLQINNNLKRDPDSRIYHYLIESMDQPILVRFNKVGKPLEISM